MSSSPSWDGEPVLQSGLRGLHLGEHPLAYVIIDSNNLRLPWHNDRYVSLKITNNTPAVRAAARKELDLTDHIFSAPTSHPGREYIRGVLDSFEVEGPHGTHLCMAMEPLRQPLWMLGQQSGLTSWVQPRTIKAVLPSILKSLDYLHSEANIIHTGGSHVNQLIHASYLTLSQISRATTSWFPLKMMAFLTSTPSARQPTQRRASNATVALFTSHATASGI